MKNKIFARAEEIATNPNVSNYPEPFYSMMAKREKRRLGYFFGLSQFGVNHTRLKPDGISALFHEHSVEEEFIYILEGTAILKTEEGEFTLSQGDCAGFKPKNGAHQLLNKSDKDVVYLEIGYRSNNDSATYPEDDIVAFKGDDAKWKFTHKDGTPY